MMTVTSTTTPTSRPGFSDALRRADVVAAELRATAAERDRANADPVAEIDLLRQADLLQVGEPVEFGGSGLDYGQSQQITRRTPAATHRSPTSLATTTPSSASPTCSAPPSRLRRSPAVTRRSARSGAVCRIRVAGPHWS